MKKIYLNILKREDQIFIKMNREVDSFWTFFRDKLSNFIRKQVTYVNKN